MNRNQILKQTTLAVAGLALSAVGAHAQGIITTAGTVIATQGDQVPGAPVGVLFGATGTFDTGVMDDEGRVYFRGRLQGSGVVATNERALFVGTSRADLTMIIRGGDPVPTLGGETLNTATAQGIGGSRRVAANGQMFWTSSFSGGTTTTANDSAIFFGTPGSFVIAAREGDPAPGTVGATISSGLGGLSNQPTGIINSGRITFQSSTAGGDTNTANNAAWFTGVPGALEMLIRKGDTIPGGGEVLSGVGFSVIMNSSGQVFHDEPLSTVLGTPPATAGNNAVLMVYTPGVTPGTGTNAVLLREGDPAPAGTGSGTIMGVTSAFSGPFGFGTQAFNNNGKALVSVALFPGLGDAVLGVNDNILYLAQVGSTPTVIMRKGDAAPGLTGGETFGTVNTSNTVLNNNDRVCFNASLVGGSVTTANDQSVWSTATGSLQMVVREGDPAPGTVGALIGNVMGLGNYWFNDMNQLTFQADLTGGDVALGNSSMLYSWTPDTGLTPIIRGGDQIDVSNGGPSVFKTVGTWGGIQFSNGDCRALTFNQAGKITINVNFTDGTSAVMTVHAPKKSGTPFCSGDGSGTACPCGNSGLAGNGCANSSFASGANLMGFGNAGATAGTDTLTLVATNIPGPGLFFQGTGTFGGGVAFGDGLLCAGGTITRLGVVFPTGSSATYPGGLTPLPIHIAGATAPGDVRTYQCWYRDSDAGFCTPNTFNLTQGIQLTWN